MTEFDQKDQVIFGSQQNAGRDIINYTKETWKPPLMLPPRAQPFVGREEDLAWLLQQLTMSEAGVTLGLCGPGGIGKTALAAEALTHLIAQDAWSVHFPDGIFYHSFYIYPSLAVAFEEIARVFGEEPNGDPFLVARRVVSRRRALLVFDGVEVLDDTRLLRELGGKNAVLVLSRRRSDAPDQAHRCDLTVLSQEQALALLQQLAGSYAIDRLSAECLVQQIGGYPLALQLIGSYLSSYQQEVGDYLKWFESKGLATIHFGERQYQSVQILLHRTYDVLTSKGKQLFLLQGLLAPAPFPMELAQTILECPEQESQQTLGLLVNMGVLRRQGRHYEVSHLLIHTFATEQLFSRTSASLSLLPEIIPIWRGRLLNTLAMHFEENNRYNRSDLALWYPHILHLASDNDLTAEQFPSAAYLFAAAGLAAFAQGKYTEAEPLYVRALTISEQQLGAEHPVTARCLNNLAALYNHQGRYTEAEPLYVRALAISEQQLGAEHPDTALSLNNLALLYDNQGKYAEAEPLYVRALEIYEQQSGAEHPNTASCLNNLADLYRTQGKYAEAEPLYVHALEIYEQQLGAEHPNTANSLNNLALLYDNQGKYAEAEPLYVRALEIYEQQLGSEHPDTARFLNNLATHYNNQGKYEEAEPLYVRALEIYEQQLGTEHPATANSLNNLALLYDNQKKYAEAEPLYVRALEIYEQQLGSEHPDTALCLNNLAGLYRDQGMYVEAEPLYQRAIIIFEHILGSNHPSTQTVRQSYLLLQWLMKYK